MLRDLDSKSLKIYGNVIFPQGADASSSIRQVVSGTLMGRMVALKMIYLPHNPVIVVFLRKRVFEMSLC